MQATIPALPPPTTTPEYTATEVARLCGYTTDKWTRNQRQTLEEIFKQCRGGDRLIAALKSPTGKYTSFALQQIQELQRHTSTGVPKLQNGKIVMRGGKAELVCRDRQMTLAQYTEQLIKKYGESERPEQTPEQELIETDPDRTSTAIVWAEQKPGTAAIEVLDNNNEIVTDTRNTLQGFRQRIFAQFHNLGQQDGAIAIQNYQIGMQQSINQGIADAATIAEAETPKRVGRSTQKKK